MKKIIFSTLCFVLISMQSLIAQTNLEQNKPKELSNSKSSIELMALDSITQENGEIFSNSYFRYDNRGNIIFLQAGYHKNINTFNEDTLMLEGLYCMWDYDSNAYIMHEKKIYTYDNNRNLIEELMFMYIDNAWQQNFKIQYEYTNNIKTQERYYQYEESSLTWYYSSKSDYFYNENGLLSELKDYFIQGSNPVLNSVTTYLYDDNNNLTSTTILNYSGNNTIAYGIKTTNTYNNNLLVLSITEIYNADLASLWEFSFKKEILYNSSNLALETYYYMFNGSEWGLHRKDSFNYDNNNNLTMQFSFMNYDGQMVCNNKFANIFDYNYNSENILQIRETPDIYFSYTNYNNMITKQIASNNYSPGNENTWTHDTSLYHYSTQSFIINSLPNNIIYNNRDFLVYPNPANEKTLITLSGKVDKLEISIFDMQGRCIEKQVKQAVDKNLELSIDVSKFEKGTYIIQLKSNQYKQSKKLIVF